MEAPGTTGGGTTGGGTTGGGATGGGTTGGGTTGGGTTGGGTTGGGTTGGGTTGGGTTGGGTTGGGTTGGGTTGGGTTGGGSTGGGSTGGGTTGGGTTGGGTTGGGTTGGGTTGGGTTGSGSGGPGTAPAATIPKTSYAVIDTGTDYIPAAIANNGMILATGTLTSQNVITDYPSVISGYCYGTYLAGRYVKARWVKGVWQVLQVPGSTQVMVNDMNNNGAVAGAAAFQNSTNPLSSDVRGVLWTNDPAHPQIQSADKSFDVTAFLGEEFEVASRTYTFCTDGTAGDYSMGGIYGTQVNQVFGVPPNYSDSRDTDTSSFDLYDSYYYGPATYFDPSSVRSTALAAPIYTGTFYKASSENAVPSGEVGTDIFGHNFSNGPETGANGLVHNLAFTGTDQFPALSNSNWLISDESVWSFASNTGTDILPGNPVNTLKYYSMTSPPAGVLSGGTKFPDWVNGWVLAITRATQASDDMVAVTGTSGGQYVWNFPNAQAQPIPIHDTLLGISTRYLTPPPTASGTTPVPAFQVLGAGYLWEPKLDGTTGLPITPAKYIGTAMSDLLTTATNWTQFSPTGINDAGAIVGTAFALDQHGNIVGNANGSNIQHGLLLLPVDLAVDANRDGYVVTVSGSAQTDANGNALSADTTTQDKPFRFWLNNDQDDKDSGETVPATSPDYNNSQIKKIRDLEDFTRLTLHFGGLQDAIANGTIKVGLKWKTTVSGSPKIKVWRNFSSNGGLDYLTSTSVAQQELALTNPGEVGGSVYMIPQLFWQQIGLSSSQPNAYLLFEGGAEGEGQLEMVFQDQNGNQIGEGGSVWIDLKDIKRMYERVKATPSSISYPDSYTGPNNAPPEPNVGLVQDPNGFPPDYSSVSWQPTQQYIVFVHGWNTDYNGDTTTGETLFKRLWQRGYKGRFTRFYWPTYTGVFTFNDSEYRAWKYGASLKQYMASLPNGYAKDLVSHSMGGIVGSSALQKGMSLDNYVLLNAAIPAECFDTNPELNQWSYTTPDGDTDPGTKALGYIGQLSSVSGNLVNFYLTNDSATTVAWVANNAGFKPQPFDTDFDGYFYVPGYPIGKKLGIEMPYPLVQRYVGTAHEAMAYVDQSRTKALGAESRAAAVISGTSDMDNYGFGTDHSAQWNLPIQQVQPCYYDILTNFNLKQIYLDSTHQ